MKHGAERFETYLTKLDELFKQASEQLDPATGLFQNGARTPLFMLEGLARLYSHLHDKKAFSQIEDHAKSVEDALGAIDYYDGFAKQFAEDKSLPDDVLEFTRSRSAESAADLNELLREKGWIGPDADRIRKMRDKLEDVDWLDDKHEVEAISAYYSKHIAKIAEFAAQHKAGFTELESQVHELRRKLRWLSIFPQALQGTVQLTDTPSNDPALAEYLTPEITGSPFNKMPAAGTNDYVLVFNRDNFLALSWMIAELGKLKDQGLRTVLLAEAGHASPPDKAAEADILKQSSKVVNTYFKEQSLNHLISGITAAH